MATDHQAYYTAIFLQVSFQAIKHSMAGKAEDDLPCWLDTGMLMMLSRELRRCRDQPGLPEAARQALATATTHCGLLLAQCPGQLNSRLCHHHLDAILSPLQEAISLLAAPQGHAGHRRQAGRLIPHAWRRRR